jgi:hypothetical protein
VIVEIGIAIGIALERLRDPLDPDLDFHRMAADCAGET